MRQDLEFQADGRRPPGGAHHARCRCAAVPGRRDALPTPDSCHWFTGTGRTRAPAWKNEVTLRSVDLLLAYEPGAYIERIAPTPLLMVVAAGDHLTPSDLALEASGRARKPKRLELLPGGHFDAYVGDGFQQASRAERAGSGRERDGVT